jgi:hypothetical protein
MSASLSKADIERPDWHVCLVPKPDIGLIGNLARTDPFLCDILKSLCEAIFSC